MRRFSRSLLLLLSAAALASGCGGGTDGTGAVPPTTAVTSSGAMAKGSVILNGTHFDSAGARISDDRGRGDAQLATGMVVRLRGRSDDLVSGVADRIDVENEVRGAIASVDPAADPQRLEVGGLVVVVDPDTVYANVAGFAGLAPGARIEVHGLRDADGLVRATRVEKVGAPAVDGLDELRGPVGVVDTTAHRFTLNGTVTVDYARATFHPAGASESSLTAGRVVEVRGSLSGSVFAASDVDIEDLEDADLSGATGERQEIEGFVSAFDGSPSFLVNGRPVTKTSGTRFKGGASVDLDDNAIVEVQGTLDGRGVLVASEVRFRRTRVILQGQITAADTAQRTLELLGRTAQANDLTRIEARPVGGTGVTDLLSDIAAGDCVEVRGHLEGAVFVAEWIRERPNCSSGDVAQARVTAKDPGAARVTLLGTLVATLPDTATYIGGDGQTLTRDQFLAAVTPAGTNGVGTLVKIRGAFGPDGLVAAEAELKEQ